MAMMSSTLRSTTHQIVEPLPYQTLYYNNTIDHLAPFNPPSSSSKSTTFEHRYLLNDDYFGQQQEIYNWDDDATTTCPGPILLYAGNEGAITGFWNGNGFMHYLAEKYGGLLVFPEERYYGTSIPTTDCCTYLTTQQVLEDYVELLNHIKIQYNASSCPTIVFGGSYGGTLAAYMRYAYPHIVQGALAASSELGYYDIDGWEERNITQYTFAEVVAAQYSRYDGCLEAISDATDAIEEVADNSVLLDVFNFCDESSLKPYKSSIFTYGLEGLPQGNYPYKIGNRPAWPVQYVCNIMVDTSIPLLQRAAKATAITMGYALEKRDTCLLTPEEGPGNIPGDGPGKGSWGYQSCTETLHVFSSTSSKDGHGVRPFDYKAEIGELVQTCIELYGVVPNTKILAERYGGFDIAKSTTNTIFSSGKLDPWGGAAVLARDGGTDADERGVYFFRMKNGAHHLDLKGWHKDDPADVKEVRKREESIIMGWVKDWFQQRHQQDWDKSQQNQMNHHTSAVSS